MLIALVSEFPQDDYFQWRVAFDINMQRKLGVFVKTVTINPYTIDFEPNHHHWNFLKKADLVFVYCSRNNFPKKVWDWWQLPQMAKQFMKPEAKMIAQFDQEFIWVFKPKQSWWADYEQLMKRYDHSDPKKFFERTGILDVPDAIGTVLEHPLYEEYTNTPIFYLPLPQLNRYNMNVPYKFKLNNIALMNHTSYENSVNHTIENVIKREKIPVTIFNSLRFGRSYMGNLWAFKHGLEIGSKSLTRLSLPNYMEELSSCFCGIDDAENYIGWSRFVMECAIAKIPCIGSCYGNKLFFPDLYIEHKDYKTQRQLIKKLQDDEDFYKQVVDKSRIEVQKHLNDEMICRKLLEIGKSIGAQSSDADIERYLFLDVIAKSLPNKLPPPRPTSEDIQVFDKVQRKTITQAEWDAFYGNWKRFMDDRNLYKELQRIAIERTY